MLTTLPLALVALAGGLYVKAAPTLEARSITTLSTVQISAYKPYSFYASAAYCNPTNTMAWNCGGNVEKTKPFVSLTRALANCNANPTFHPVASGGDGAIVQYWYVGYDSTRQVTSFPTLFQCICRPFCLCRL